MSKHGKMNIARSVLALGVGILALVLTQTLQDNGDSFEVSVRKAATGSPVVLFSVGSGGQPVGTGGVVGSAGTGGGGAPTGGTGSGGAPTGTGGGGGSPGATDPAGCACALARGEAVSETASVALTALMTAAAVMLCSARRGRRREHQG